MAKTTETGMTMNNLDLLPNDDVSKDRKEGKDGGEGGLAVDDKERDMVDLEAVGEVADSSAAFVCVGDDDHLMSPINEFLEPLVSTAQAMKQGRGCSPRTVDRCDFQFPLAGVSTNHQYGAASQNIPGWGKKKSLTMLLPTS